MCGDGRVDNNTTLEKALTDVSIRIGRPIRNRNPTNYNVSIRSMMISSGIIGLRDLVEVIEFEKEKNPSVNSFEKVLIYIKTNSRDIVKLK